jgi:hypothetical protein
MRKIRSFLTKGAALTLLLAPSMTVLRADPAPGVVDATTLHRKIMCGYQGWFNCPGDGANLGWIHWSAHSNRIGPDTLKFDLWPDMSAYSAEEQYPAPGFTYPDGKPATLFSSHNPRTILRHFEWMRDYGIDGVWLQRFLVGLPGGPRADRYQALLDVLHGVRDAAAKTGRVWAIAYDEAAMPPDKMYDTLTADWKKLVDEKITSDPRYLHEGGLPVVEIWGFYHNGDHDFMTPEAGNKLIDFFQQPGPYQALVVGGGEWGWRSDPNPEWAKMFRRFKVWMPWNVGHYDRDAKTGLPCASTSTWEGDLEACKKNGTYLIPVIYPRYGTVRNRRKGQHVDITREHGQFLWDQYHRLSELGVDTAYVAMFDELDEGTAIFKITNHPPVHTDLVNLEGMPSDWYLRLVAKGGEMLREGEPVPAEIPIKP